MKKLAAFGFGVITGMYISHVLSKIEVSRVDIYDVKPNESYDENDIRNMIRAVYGEEED